MVTTLERSPSRKLVASGRAAIYLRLSSQRQREGVSLGVQLETCRRYCETNNVEIVAELQDIKSGLVIEREEYQRALDLAKQGKIDRVVVFRYDRVGRDNAEYARMLKDFAKAGIQLISASGESPDPFMQQLMGVLAWNESRTLSIRVSGSKMMRHLEGKWNGRSLFGYNLEKHPEGGTYLVPNDEGSLVTQLFQLYSDGRCSLADLRTFLTEHGITKSRYAIWYILSNRVYLGQVPHGKVSRSQFKPPEELQWTEGQHEALIGVDIFNRVQARLAENKHRQRGGPTAKYIFSGLVFCGNCGHRYQARTFKRRDSNVYVDYRCNRRHGFGDCQAKSVLESRIREQVFPPIEKLLHQLSQKELQKAIREKIEQQQAAKHGS